MRVTNISVRGLFGIFDHEIPLNETERVTIIHGPNGFGKTVVLRMIAAVVEGTTFIFEQTPFDEFSLTLSDGTSRVVRRRVEKKAGSTESAVELEYLIRDSAGSELAASPPVPENLPDVLYAHIDRFVPRPFTLRGKRWIDNQSGREYSLAAILKKFPKASQAIPKKHRPKPIFEMPGDLEVFFVETNRLSSELVEQHSILRHDAYSVAYGGQEAFLEDGPRQITPRVKQYSEDVVQKIRFVLADYAKHSQESDRTFPERLVRFLRDGEALAERDILSRMAELENKRRRLITLGLLDSESGLRDLTEDDLHRAREALTIYVRDVQEKLQVFDDLAHRIGSLVDIVNDRFKYKHLRIDRQRGFRVFSDTNAPIRIEDLSSGEQHELVVLYELLFRAPKNGLILVDEPEISLHVAWQSRFLADLIGILQLTDAYAIVATHSPVIIGPRNDLTVELKGPPSSARTRQHA
jgi:predicted ATPase